MKRSVQAVAGWVLFPRVSIGRFYRQRMRAVPSGFCIVHSNAPRGSQASPVPCGHRLNRLGAAGQVRVAQFHRAAKYWTGLSVQQGCSTLAASNKAPPSRGSAGRHEKEKKTVVQGSAAQGGAAARAARPCKTQPGSMWFPSPACCKTALLCMLLPDKPNGLQPGGAAWLQIISTPLSRLSHSPHTLPVESRSQSSMSSWQRRRSAAFLGAGLLGLGRLLARTLANSMLEKLCATLESWVLARDQRRGKRACERECLYVLQNSVGRFPMMKTMSLNPYPSAIYLLRCQSRCRRLFKPCGMLG